LNEDYQISAEALNIDVTAPEATTVVMTSDNAVTGTRAKVGDVVTLTIVTDTIVTGVSTTLDGSAMDMT
jgi:hypothetical protein